jgi:bifunctional UDP-N-acetylglucosamine pyrophosphorylase/glucosamine-1-phosphate N-acetyltransferase
MQALILAAGECSRFWPLNDRHKAMNKVQGKTILQRTIDSVRRYGIDDIIVVRSPGAEYMDEELPGVKFVVQKEPKGMGDAILSAEKYLTEDFLVLNPKIANFEEIISEAVAEKERSRVGMVLPAQVTETPELYGVITMDGERVTGVVEKPKGLKTGLRIGVIYLLPKEFLEYQKRVKEWQYSFEDALALYMKEKDVRTATPNIKSFSMKYSWHLLAISHFLCSLTKRHISESANIADSAKIEGEVHIGENTRVFENAVINGPCWIGDNCVIGNNSLIRDNTVIEEGVKIGMGTEITRSHLHSGTTVHSGFIGDSVIGRDCRIGAGFVTANRRFDRKTVGVYVKGKMIDSGMRGLGAIVGARTNIGIMVGTMPGVHIGSNCLIGPGKIVKENVPDSSKVV